MGLLSLCKKNVRNRQKGRETDKQKEIVRVRYVSYGLILMVNCNTRNSF